MSNEENSLYESLIPRSPQTSQAQRAVLIPHAPLPPRMIPIQHVEHAPYVAPMPDALRLIPHTVPAPRIIPIAPSLPIIPIAPSLRAHGMSNKNRPNSFTERVGSNKGKDQGHCR